MIILAIIEFFVILILNLYRDLRYFYKNRATNHNNRFWIRLWCLLPAIIMFTIGKTGKHHVFEWPSLLYLALSIAMVGFTWLNLFDGPYNILRRENWFYPGSDGPEDGVIENILQRWPWLQVVKIALTIALIIIYILV